MAEPALDEWGVYVHVPFCPRRCTYCDFAISVGQTAEVRASYVDALIEEWEGESLPPGPPRAVYLGGGTPSMLDPQQIQRLLGAISRRGGGLGTEVTLEVNPETVDVERIQGFRESGVTRLSIGVQALQDHHLEAMHRGHRAADVVPLVTWARAAKYRSISVDAIYGWPGQTQTEWQDTINGLVQLGPDHVSLYQLQIEPKTPLEKLIRRQALMPADPDLIGDMADWAYARLAQSGYQRYEISSVARPGHQSQLNRLYWTMNPYVAIGVGAHAFNGNRRWWNVRSLQEYLRRVAGGEDPQAGEEVLDRAAAMREYCWLGLRTIQGFSRQRFFERFGADPVATFASVWNALHEVNLVNWDNERIWLLPRGLDLANRVMAALVDADPEELSG